MNLKRVAFGTTTVVLGSVLVLLGCELLVRFLSPQPYYYPRYQFSEQYGHLMRKGVRIVNGLPGVYEFHYTTNEYGFRGPLVPASKIGDRHSMVIVGDSYSFGTGVDDGEEYSEVMQRLLGPDYVVNNIAVEGFTLTQEIRMFYEFGIQLRPQTVILQFCGNDPGENPAEPVTVYRDGHFVFRDTGDVSSPRIQAFLANSPIQKSHLYNFLRLRVIIPLYEKLHGESNYPGQTGDFDNHRPIKQDTLGSPLERYYNDLFVPFAKDLKKRGIRMLMISVNGEVDRFPAIKAKILELDHDGFLEYIDVQPWFLGVTDFGSPEGHKWGAKAHKIIGEHLAAVLQTSR